MHRRVSLVCVCQMLTDSFIIYFPVRDLKPKLKPRPTPKPKIDLNFS